MAESKPAPKPDDEPETYDLAFDLEDEAVEAPKPPVKKPAPSSVAGSVPASPSKPAPPAEPDIYEMDDLPTVHDPRDTAPPPVRKPAATPRPSDATAEPAASPSTPDASAEPASVSPAKARAQREEQRIRAAQEEAEADARRLKIKLVVAGIVAAVVVVAYIVFRMM